MSTVECDGCAAPVEVNDLPPGSVRLGAWCERCQPVLRAKLVAGKYERWRGGDVGKEPS